MRRRSPLLLAGLLALLPACGHKGNPLPPRRKTPPMPAGFRLAERGDAIELLARAPSASVDGVAYDALALEFLYGTGEVDLEKAGTHLLVRCSAGEQVVKTIPLPASGTLLRGAVRAIAAGHKGPRSLIKALVVQAPLEAPRELSANVVEDGVALSWKGVRPKEVAPPPLPTRPGFPPAGAGALTTGAIPGKSAKPTAGETSAPASASTSTSSLEKTAPAPAEESGGTADKSGTANKSGGAATTAGEGALKGEEAKPARRNGFFVYRRSGEPGYGSPLGSEPLELRSFKDKTAPLQTRVCYVVRAVASPDPLIESAPSNEACVVMRDITPPAAPAGLAVMPRPGGLELIWSPSSEQDLAGYRVFRATAGGEAARLSELEPGRTSYLDASAQPGIRYSYTVVAFDQTGNQSAASEAVEAALP